MTSGEFFEYEPNRQTLQELGNTIDSKLDSLGIVKGARSMKY